MPFLEFVTEGQRGHRNVAPMMMENVNYGRDELMYLNMCRKGIIGDFLHAEAAYIHELRFQMKEEDSHCLCM